VSPSGGLLGLHITALKHYRHQPPEPHSAGQKAGLTELAIIVLRCLLATAPAGAAAISTQIQPQTTVTVSEPKTGASVHRSPPAVSAPSAVPAYFRQYRSKEGRLQEAVILLHVVLMHFHFSSQY